MQPTTKTTIATPILLFLFILITMVADSNTNPNADIPRSFSLPTYRDTPPLDHLIRDQNLRFYSNSPPSSTPSSPTATTVTESPLPPLPLITPDTNIRELQAFYDRDANARRMVPWRRSASADTGFDAQRGAGGQAPAGLARNFPPICVLRQERVGVEVKAKEAEEANGSGGSR